MINPGRNVNQALTRDVIMANVFRNDATGCWEWIRCKNEHGYGRLSYRGRSDKAHRVAFELWNGPIVGRMHVCHKCDNPSCCNPRHLFLGTAMDNKMDSMAKGRWRGAVGVNHPLAKLSEDNVRTIRSSPEMLYVQASMYGVTPRVISLVKRRITYRSVPE